MTREEYMREPAGAEMYVRMGDQYSACHKVRIKKGRAEVQLPDGSFQLFDLDEVYAYTEPEEQALINRLKVLRAHSWSNLSNWMIRKLNGEATAHKELQEHFLKRMEEDASYAFICYGHELMVRHHQKAMAKTLLERVWSEEDGVIPFDVCLLVLEREHKGAVSSLLEMDTSRANGTPLQAAAWQASFSALREWKRSLEYFMVSFEDLKRPLEKEW